MEKEFVPYELALRMKQLGFNEPCFGHYSNGEFVYGSHTNNTMQRFRYAAPLFQQAFRWFRKRGFLIDVTSLGKDEYEFYIKWSFAYSFLSDTYKTYEEAETACLKKLIEIVEQTNAEMAANGVYR